MKFDPWKHHRRSIRLRGYDYTTAGAYFVTIRLQDNECLLGRVADQTVLLNDAGRMVNEVWTDLPSRYPGVDVDEYIVMPNHIHGIIRLTNTDQSTFAKNVGATPCGCPDALPRVNNGQSDEGQPQGAAPTISRPDVVHRFKTLNTKRYIDGVNQSNWPRFEKRIWQRNYYEHVVRGGEDLERIRVYMRTNPERWVGPDVAHVPEDNNSLLI